jgi:hypothetical protein
VLYQFRDFYMNKENNDIALFKKQLVVWL